MQANENAKISKGAKDKPIPQEEPWAWIQQAKNALIIKFFTRWDGKLFKVCKLYKKYRD